MPSNPVAVNAGNDCANLLSTGCSHITEMVIPTTEFSCFFVIPLFNKWFRGLIRTFAYTYTSVAIHSTRITTIPLLSQVCTELDHDNVDFIESSSPIVVQLYGNTVRDNITLADAFMTTIPGIDQYQSHHTIHVPDFTFESYISFIITSSDTDGIRLD